MIKVLRVGHATFTTPDLDREVAYYSDVMGLIVTERDKNRAFLATRTGFEAIALERGDKPALTRLSFQVAPDADFAEAWAREQYGRRGESVALWLVPRDAIRDVEDWADEFDLKYRRVDGYSIKARLKEARDRAGTTAD